MLRPGCGDCSGMEGSGKQWWLFLLTTAAWAVCPSLGATIQFEDGDSTPGRLLGQVMVDGLAPNVEYRLYWASSTWEGSLTSYTVKAQPIGEPIAVFFSDDNDSSTTAADPAANISVETTNAAFQLEGSCVGSTATAAPADGITASTTAPTTPSESDDANESAPPDEANESQTTTPVGRSLASSCCDASDDENCTGDTSDNTSDNASDCLELLEASATAAASTLTTAAPQICGAEKPPAATHLLLQSVTPTDGDRRLSTVTEQLKKVYDWTGSPPGSVATRVSFTDESDLAYIVAGAMLIEPQAPEASDVEGYRVYFSGADGKVPQLLEGGRNAWIGEAAATGDPVVAQLDGGDLGVLMPEDIQRFVVLTYNRDGEASVGLEDYFYDVGDFGEKQGTTEILMYGAIGLSIGACCCLCVALLRYLFLPRVSPAERNRSEDVEDVEHGASSKVNTSGVLAGVLRIEASDEDEATAPKGLSVLPWRMGASVLKVSKPRRTRPSQEVKALQDWPLKLAALNDEFELWLAALGEFTTARVVEIGQDYGAAEVDEARTRAATKALRQREKLLMNLVQANRFCDVKRSRLRWPPVIDQRVEISVKVTPLKELAHRRMWRDKETKDYKGTTSDGDEHDIRDVVGLVWVPGRIERIPSPNIYVVRLTTESYRDQVMTAEARQVRPHFVEGDEVLVPVNNSPDESARSWLRGRVERASSLQSHEVLAFQTLAVRIDEDAAGADVEAVGVMKISSREVRWPPPTEEILAKIEDGRQERFEVARKHEEEKFEEMLPTDGPVSVPSGAFMHLPLSGLQDVLGCATGADGDEPLVEKGLPCMNKHCKFTGSAPDAKFCSHCGTRLMSLQESQKLIGVEPILASLLLPHTPVAVRVSLAELACVKEGPVRVKGLSGRSVFLCSYQDMKLPRLLLEGMLGPGVGATPLAVAGAADGSVELVGYNDRAAYGRVISGRPHRASLVATRTGRGFMSFHFGSAPLLQAVVHSEGTDIPIELARTRYVVDGEDTAVPEPCWEFSVTEGADWVAIVMVFIGTVALGHPAAAQFAAAVRDLSGFGDADAEIVN